ncbi:MAG: sigma-54 dependent transcriptional regulator [Acidobacteriota bacterium]|nr:sigma-54 dependent transcriptional regulator [Acidobacteriota bacterium]MDQ7087865.1 sigma-54 dependent transcriptional regulator [Acidobacteriota bacterium]
MSRILIADDEANLRTTLTRTLRQEGYAVSEARDGVEAVSLLRRGGIDAVILDLSMPRLDGFGVLEALAEEEGAPPVIVLTAHAGLDNAVRAVQAGAWDFLEKPPSAEAILLRLRRALESARDRAEREPPAGAPPMDAILGDSPAVQAMRRAIEKIARHATRVLVLGENGTGKELVARAIHRLSPRAGGPLVRVNCAAVPAELFEAELFGHVKGAFTGAVQHRRGRFERASGGTLFLDEIGEIPLPAQAKLLRALEEGEIERVGAESAVHVDARIVAATNRDLPAQIRRGRFRQDLFYRLEQFIVEVPPLRARREDIPLLARHFLERARRECGRAAPVTLGDDALEVLGAQSWPGNVRQLRNLMERLVILAERDEIDAAMVRAHLGRQTTAPAAAVAAGGRLGDAVAAFEREFIAAALERHGGNMSATARELGLERSSLYKKMRTLGMERG